MRFFVTLNVYVYLILLFVLHAECIVIVVSGNCNEDAVVQKERKFRNLIREENMHFFRKHFRHFERNIAQRVHCGEFFCGAASKFSHHNRTCDEISCELTVDDERSCDVGKAGFTQKNVRLA